MAATFPFSAFVGQERAKCALLLNLVDPALGGVLLVGPSGTGKSVLLRASASLPLGDGHVTVPAGAAEAALLGVPDWIRALGQGLRGSVPGLPARGLLARAQGRLLLLDDVHLFPEPVLRLALGDPGRGAPIPAGALLSGEPMRPSLLDRFGLAVSLAPLETVPERAEMLRRVLAFAVAPETFQASWRREEEALVSRVRVARDLLPRVRIASTTLELAAKRAREARSRSVRGDRALARAALAWAAWNGRTEVTSDDIQVVADLALAHRAHGGEAFGRPAGQGAEPAPHDRDSPETRKSDDEALPPPGASAGEAASPPPPAGHAAGVPAGGVSSPLPASDALRSSAGNFSEYAGALPSRPSFASGALPRPPDPAEAPEGTLARTAPWLPREGGVHGHTPGRSAPSRRDADRGAIRGSRKAPGRAMEPDWNATFLAALPWQPFRPRTHLVLALRPEDLRQRFRRPKAGRILLFLWDASGSMGASRRLEVARQCIRAILEEAYRGRDRVALMAFRHGDCRLVLPLTRSVDLAEKRLRDLSMGGRTPLSLALRRALAFTQALRARDPDCPARILLFSDGRANQAEGRGDPRQEALDACRALSATPFLSFTIVDSESGIVRAGLCREMARMLGADYHALEAFAPSPTRRGSSGGREV